MQRGHIHVAVVMGAVIFLTNGCAQQEAKVRFEQYAADAATRELNKRIVREAFAAIDANDFGKFRSLLAGDFTLNSPGAAHPPNQEALIKAIQATHASFPDWSHSIEELVAEGELVVVRLTAHGTFEKAYQGTAPTGQTVTESETLFLTLSAGKISNWSSASGNGAQREPAR